MTGTAAAPHQRYAVLFDVLDRQARAAILLDAEAAVRAVNETARGFLRQAANLFVECERPPERLEFAHPLTQRTFLDALEKVRQPEPPASIAQCEFHVPRSLNGDRPMFGELLSCQPPATPGGTDVLLILTRLDGPLPNLERRLHSAFNLTRRESTVAALLTQPLTEAELAATQGISVNTLRTHRKNIYAKLEVASRNELSLLLARLV
ncbi:helix-turn-helix transcriptional regulator [Stappia indica]|uniref:helix-turn-helix transcriptional regulator n=1 Tax=Stappia indica TaxID=538381 RepID=UPI001CD4CAEC|nr:helix-turn-helix domain-containing protein [Stappia indica]MCA1299007.1 helix-turn-helix domain-containing protein [Stappia indica]